ncbi:hypothetical protein ACLMJK_003942 [Lecanora helva]
MFGEDSCGRRVSLLNEHSSSSSSSTTTTTGAKPTTTTFTRPKLPSRSRPSASSISSCTSREWFDSPPSSFSGSPRHSHSPPTPPSLIRFNSSESSLARSTPSPMTPQYGFEPMDQHLKRDQAGHPYYNAPFPPTPTISNNHVRAIPNAATGYPPLQNPTPQTYYNLSAQQPLPPMNDFDLDPNTYDPTHARAQTTLQPLQTQLQNPVYNEAAIAQLSQAAFPTPSSASTATNTALPSLSTAPPTTPAKINPEPPPTTPLTTTSSTTLINPPQTNPTPSHATTKPPPPTPSTSTKKKYPCPHATRYSCTDTFTTSGHAARHGKKHTGEKNILCPTCNKAFTRKDNMKQHERTHKSSDRGSRSGSAAAESPVMSHRSRKGSQGSDVVMDTAGGNGGGIGLGLSTHADTGLGGGEGSASLPPKRPKMRSELSEIIEGISKGQQQQQQQQVVTGAGMEGYEGDMDADGEGESPGLDALATAAGAMA